MQLRDEGAVVFVLRRHQGNGLPAGREDGDALTGRMFDIEHANRQRIAILSTSWQTVAPVAPQDKDHRALITPVAQRIEKQGARATLIGGIGPKLYAVGIVFLALVAIAISGLMVRAIATGEFAGALFLVGFAALFAWQIGGFVRRNRPRTYTFDRLPETLLP